MSQRFASGTVRVNLFSAPETGAAVTVSSTRSRSTMPPRAAPESVTVPRSVPSPVGRANTSSMQVGSVTSSHTSRYSPP